jgi:enoyl-CoA hydratase
MGSTVLIEHDGEIDWVTLNRPESLNALTDQMNKELLAYFSGLSRSSTCRVVILRGAGRAFCAGLDLKDFDPVNPNIDTEALPNVVRHMRTCPQPIIALIRGAACGGGFSLALASDVRLAAPSAKMNVAYVKLGLSGCELGTSYFLPRMVGPSVANELMMTGRFIHAERALATGLVSAVAPDDELDKAGRELATEMLAASRMGLRKTKETIALVSQTSDFELALELEDATQKACMRDPSFAERVAGFAKRA